MKTRNLIGPALDWAVANSRGIEVYSASGLYVYTHRDGEGWQYSYEPSRRWEQGGPIIEQEAIELAVYGNQWRAVMYIMQESIYQEGSTPLIAAMRCYVASKMGDEVDIPEELK